MNLLAKTTHHLNPFILPTDDERYVIGPTVASIMFFGGKKLGVPRNLRPYPNDAEYITAMLASELADIKLPLSADAHLLHDFDEYLAENAEEIVEVLNELQTISGDLFPSRPLGFWLRPFSCHLVDPATYEITGIVDWECVGTLPHWENAYPLFLRGTEITKEVKPLDMEKCRENWEKTQLRPVFDRNSGDAPDSNDGKDEIRWEFWERLERVVFGRKVCRNGLNMQQIR